MTFSTPFGWINLVGNNALIGRVQFGFAGRVAAERALRKWAKSQNILDFETAHNGSELQVIAERMQAYMAGSCEDFRDVSVEHTGRTAFQKEVLGACRKIGFGRTLSYAQLAARVGSPGAARAVGNVMASNRVPLIIPCHRVVASGGALGGFSAIGGVGVKQQLLELEAEDALVG